MANFGELKYKVGIGFSRTDLESQFGDAINTALKEIQQRHSFRFMKVTDTVTMKANSKSVRLPADFKELTSGKSAVSRIDSTNGRKIPCVVRDQNDLERVNGTYLCQGGTNRRSYQSGGLDLYLDWNDQYPSLNLVFVIDGSDITFAVNYFRYLPNLRKNTDANGITREYEQAVIHKAKAILFAAVEDPMTGTEETLYENDLAKAIGSDNRIKNRGVQLRM